MVIAVSVDVLDLLRNQEAQFVWQKLDMFPKIAME